jgi:beta-lactam-binding protein with PASTA domain
VTTRHALGLELACPINGLDQVPDFVGMTQARATHLLASLGVPEQLVTVPSARVPKGIVTSQDPPYPDGLACLCAVVLRVSSGPS